MPSGEKFLHGNQSLGTVKIGAKSKRFGKGLNEPDATTDEQPRPAGNGRRNPHLGWKKSVKNQVVFRPGVVLQRPGNSFDSHAPQPNGESTHPDAFGEASDSDDDIVSPTPSRMASHRMASPRMASPRLDSPLTPRMTYAPRLDTRGIPVVGCFPLESRRNDAHGAVDSTFDLDRLQESLNRSFGPRFPTLTPAQSQALREKSYPSPVEGSLFVHHEGPPDSPFTVASHLEAFHYDRLRRAQMSYGSSPGHGSCHEE